jgi:hypothetical protein
LGTFLYCLILFTFRRLHPCRCTMATSSSIDLLSPKSVISDEEEHGLALLSSACARYHRDKQAITVQREEQRVSCHRCGNIRKKKTVCSKINCPHIFCGRCTVKMKEEYGEAAFIRGCPVCRGLCCCSNKTLQCSRINHCYRKCPATRNARLPSKKRSAAALDFLADCASVVPNADGHLEVDSAVSSSQVTGKGSVANSPTQASEPEGTLGDKL